MSKSTLQVLADLRHVISLLEAITKGSGGNRRIDDYKALEDQNNNLKRKIVTLNKSNGQFKGIAERKEKQVLRVQAENKRISDLLIQSQLQIKRYEEYVDYLKNNTSVNPEFDAVRLFNLNYSIGEQVYFITSERLLSRGHIESKAELDSDSNPVVKIRGEELKVKTSEVTAIPK